MDYEKKYKEALERAKEKRDEYKRLDGEESFVPSDIEYIFPELKESEDEKVRKELLAVVNDLLMPDEQQSRFVAWLEKQGRQKSSWSEDDEVGLGDAMWAIEQARGIAKDESDMGNLWYAERWLKSVKERMKGE